METYIEVLDANNMSNSSCMIDISKFKRVKVHVINNVEPHLALCDIIQRANTVVGRTALDKTRLREDFGPLILKKKDIFK